MFKIIAIISMLLDHIGFVFFPEHIIFRVIGRIAFPIFAFGISYGYLKSKNIFNYGKRIFLLAIISQPIFFLVFNSNYLNICFTLLFGLISIYIYDKQKNNLIKFSLISALLIFSEFFYFEYGAYGILMILFFFIFRDRLFLLVSQSALILFFTLINPAKIINIFAIIVIFFIYFFKKYDFKINKNFQYLFYPVHLIIIYLLGSLYGIF